MVRPSGWWPDASRVHSFRAGLLRQVRSYSVLFRAIQPPCGCGTDPADHRASIPCSAPRSAIFSRTGPIPALHGFGQGRRPSPRNTLRLHSVPLHIPPMLSGLARLAATISPKHWDPLARAWACSPWAAPRRRGHGRSMRALGLAESPAQARRAVAEHARFVHEFLAQLGGRSWPVELRHRDRPADPGRCAGPTAVSPSMPGRLIVTVHRGNWIAGAQALVAAWGPIETVAGRQLRGSWQPTLIRFLERSGITVHRNRAFARLSACLRQGGTVVVHLDGQPGWADDAQWCRRAASGPLGVRSAALLAARSRARVFFAVCPRTGPGRFALDIEPLVPDDPARPFPSSATWARCFAARLREDVRRHPGAWMMFRDEHLGRYCGSDTPELPTRARVCGNHLIASAR